MTTDDLFRCADYRAMYAACLADFQCQTSWGALRDWHSYAGRCVRQIGPMTYIFELVSKISETNNGDCWHALAAGDERLRAACTYQHYETPGVFPLSIAAFEWAGKLPHEK